MCQCVIDFDCGCKFFPINHTIYIYIYIYIFSLYIYIWWIYMTELSCMTRWLSQLEHLNQVQWFCIQFPLKPTLSIATSKNPPVVNTIYISSFCCIHVITNLKLWLNKCGDWRRQTAEMKFDTAQTMKLEYLYTVVIYICIYIYMYVYIYIYI